jgi:hypothetical protein
MKGKKPINITVHGVGVTNMIKSELLKDKGVLIVSPVGRLEVSDFEHLAQEVDPYIEQNGRLRGLMVQTDRSRVGRISQRCFRTLNS